MTIATNDNRWGSPILGHFGQFKDIKESECRLVFQWNGRYRTESRFEVLLMSLAMYHFPRIKTNPLSSIWMSNATEIQCIDV
uniref:Uncharacterized protein n=1 Tax=Tetranychus urticae TaxID=32264 RepID=T1JR89_TETUR